MPKQNRSIPMSSSPVDSSGALPARGPPPLSDALAVVGVGASAGGLEACTTLFNSVPAGTGLAFILVQHLDPTHDSMLVDLLSAHCALRVVQATDGMALQADHLYIIPPAAYLSVTPGRIHLIRLPVRQGARLPFDVLLQSLADAYGRRAICVVMSGTGADGTLGLNAIKAQGGLVVVQAPGDAGYGGMPQSAMATGQVDLVLPAGEIAAALISHARGLGPDHTASVAAGPAPSENRLAEIIELLRSRTPHDFTLYKPGTLQRRVERRMAMAEIPADHMDQYLQVLRQDAAEIDLLAHDLLINVTGFFRDATVFDFLDEKIIPDLIRTRKFDRPLRIWIAGCSTGEESYSLAILFLEQLAAVSPEIKLQVFASDVDADAVATARDGFYPSAALANVSQARLARFFIREENGYRVSQGLRATVVFTVQDVLADPPFSRLDMVSCRNLLIYLQPEAQAKVIAAFHFALREDGILVLGSAETVGSAANHFEIISKSLRIYRHVGRSRPGENDFLVHGGDWARPRTALGHSAGPPRQADLAEISRRLVLECFAPAAVLINQNHHCLFSLGATDRYLRISPGHASLDVLAMARPGLRTKLSLAIQKANAQKSRIVVPGVRLVDDKTSEACDLDIQPVSAGGENFLLICFVPARRAAAPRARADAASAPRIAELEQELEAMATELKGAIRDLDASAEEQKAINEEALSVNEEYQSTNEELLTSKEELQSLNEELTALNGQLQETLERQRRTASDLQNVLNSTDIATLFLDSALRIRFFTPATASIFSVIASDIGRPLADLHALVPDQTFIEDAHEVMRSLTPSERELAAPGAAWFIRRIMPYRTDKGAAEGVVITFTNITDRKQAARVLESAQESSDNANAAKSRFLAAASHDLRQPLQTLTLLQALMAKDSAGERQQKLVARLGETVEAMSGMLNTLLDINQIDAGVIRPEFSSFCLNHIFDRLGDELTVQAEAQHLRFRVVPCSLFVRSDKRMLEQMIRNLISNAFKYTHQGRVLLGCRRTASTLTIEVHDTGIGIPAADIKVIFEEYHQLDNPARERSRGLGLGLPIVRRLGDLLGHAVTVRSYPGRGSVFGIEIARAPLAAATPPLISEPDGEETSELVAYRSATILLVEDDPDIAELLELFLRSQGHRVTAEKDGPDALAHIKRAALQPDLILTDYNLPGGMNGLEVAVAIRQMLRREVPAIILTGDISTQTLRSVAGQNCLHLGKPVKLAGLSAIIQELIPPMPWVPGIKDRRAAAANLPVFIIDDDSGVREALCSAIRDDGRAVQAFPDAETFLKEYQPGQAGCLVLDATLPGMDGLALLRRLREAGDTLPCVMITGNSDVPMAVQAMKAGATDFIEKPVGYADLLSAIGTSIELAQDSVKRAAWREAAAGHIADLTPRQRQILAMVLAGKPSKNIAADLAISQRTVENHRAAIMKRTGSHSLPALARLAVTAELNQE